MRKLFVAAMCLFATGCATVGPYDLAVQLQPGETTIQDATVLFGAPDSRSEYADGTTLLQWLGAWPYPGDHVAVLFDSKGVMIQTQVRSRTMTRI